MKSKISLLLMLFAGGIALLAQTSNPFTGKWELNVAKSKYNPGPAPKSQTVTITDDKTTVEGVDGNGKPVRWSFTPSQGTAVPIEGMENSTVDDRRSGNRVDDNWKVMGGNVHAHGVISNHGKTLKYTMIGTDGQGRAVHNVLIYEKQ